MDEEGSGSGLQLFLMRQDKWTRAGEKCICDLSREESFLLWLITCLTEQLLMGSVSGNEPTATPVSLCPVGSEMTGTPSTRVWESRLWRWLKTLRRKNGKKLKESRKDVENFAVKIEQFMSFLSLPHYWNRWMEAGLTGWKSKTNEMLLKLSLR